MLEFGNSKAKGPTSVNGIAKSPHGRRQEGNKTWQRRKEQTPFLTLWEGRGVLAITLSHDGNTNPSWPLWRSHLSTLLLWELGFQIWTLGDTFEPQRSSGTNKCLTTMYHMLRIQAGGCADLGDKTWVPRMVSLLPFKKCIHWTPPCASPSRGQKAQMSEVQPWSEVLTEE